MPEPLEPPMRKNASLLSRRINRAHALLALGLLAPLIAACSNTPDESLPSDPHIAGLVHLCSSCHGFEGRSISPTFPRLSGQKEQYVIAQLTAFRDHTRADPHAHTYMWGMAARLTDSDITGLAAYY